MAKRYWIAKWNMGYVGTESEEEIDLHDWHTPEEVEKMTDDEAEEEVAEYAWETAKENIESWSEPGRN